MPEAVEQGELVDEDRRGSDSGSNTLLHFDPNTETFTTIAGSAPLRVAQLGGIPGEVWGADRDRQHVVVVRY